MLPGDGVRAGGLTPYEATIYTVVATYAPGRVSPLCMLSRLVLARTPYTSGLHTAFSCVPLHSVQGPRRPTVTPMPLPFTGLAPAASHISRTAGTEHVIPPFPISTLITTSPPRDTYNESTITNPVHALLALPHGSKPSNRCWSRGTGPTLMVAPHNTHTIAYLPRQHPGIPVRAVGMAHGHTFSCCTAHP